MAYSYSHGNRFLYREMSDNLRKNECIRFQSDLNPISITFISNARARNIKTKTKTKIIIIMIYIIMKMLVSMLSLS